MKKCFGIVSWLPDNAQDRQLRIDRINRIIKQINKLWPGIDILIIAQNWQEFMPNSKNNLIIKKYDDGLGILKARQTLRQEFLKLDYDYIIMLDDDAIIQCDTKTAAKDFMDLIDDNPNKFCFIHDDANINYYIPYASAQLNLCAISKFVYKLEDIPNADPQKDEAYEDGIYAALLHYKYARYEYTPNTTIRCTQFNNKSEPAPSTWVRDHKKQLGEIGKNYNKILEYISINNELPNLDLFFKYDVLLPRDAKREQYDRAMFKPRQKPLNKNKADGKDNCYLYF